MVEVSPRFAYLLLASPFVFLWLLIWVFNRDRDLRIKQLVMSGLVAVAGPISELFYFQDYWYPQSVFSLSLFDFSIFPEDVLFGFAFGGIASVIYDVLTKRRVSIPSRNLSNRYVRLAFTFFIPIGIFFGLWFSGMNSILASALSALIGTLLIVYQRRDLLQEAFGSGFSTMFVVVFCYLLFLLIAANTDVLLAQWWLLNGTSLDIKVAGIPLTEVFWAFAYGTLISPVYEFLIDAVRRQSRNVVP